VVKRHSVLDSDGRLVRKAPRRLTDGQLIEALRWMLKSRAYDQRAAILQRQGRYGVFSPAVGQEATVVGASMALDPRRDWIVPQYRELMAVVRHGYPLERVAANSMGRGSDATRIPDGVNVLPSQIAVSAQLPQATGLAWGLKLQGKDSVVLTFVGDGGSSEGDFHEALNLAGVVAAPIIFVIHNNQWAISTPRRVQSAAPSLSIRAAGYGFSGHEVDGNDVMAVHELIADAVELARSGGGPTLIEAITYRVGFHNSSDNPARYEDAREHEEALRRDPIERLVKYLRSRRLLNSQAELALRSEAAAEIDRALGAAESYPLPVAGELFENVFAAPPERLRLQRAEQSGLEPE
jgi:pyruvate dehydrogenase E1 component alpha subunit